MFSVCVYCSVDIQFVFFWCNRTTGEGWGKTLIKKTKKKSEKEKISHHISILLNNHAFIETENPASQGRRKHRKKKEKTTFFAPFHHRGHVVEFLHQLLFPPANLHTRSTWSTTFPRWRDFPKGEKPTEPTSQLVSQNQPGHNVPLLRS